MILLSLLTTNLCWSHTAWSRRQRHSLPNASCSCRGQCSLSCATQNLRSFRWLSFEQAWILATSYLLGLSANPNIKGRSESSLSIKEKSILNNIQSWKYKTKIVNGLSIQTLACKHSNFRFVFWHPVRFKFEQIAGAIPRLMKLCVAELFTTCKVSNQLQQR